MSHVVDSIVSVELEQVVIRCGCSDEQKSLPSFHARHGQPCPTPRALEDRGAVAAYYADSRMQRAWNKAQRLLGRKPGSVSLPPQE